MQSFLRQSACALLLVLTASVAVARKPFEVTAVTIGPNPITLTASGSNLSDFLSSLINTNADFNALDGRAYNASSTFLGVANALTFVTNATGTSVTFGLSPIGFSRTFTGPTSENVDDQIDAFFEKEGVETLAAFLKAIAAQSPLAVTDGNPNAPTAKGANDSFLGQGFTPADEIVSGIDGSSGAKPRYGGFGIGFNSGKFEAGDFEGNNYDFSLSGLNIGIGERVRLVTPIAINYIKVEGASIAGFGLNVALPIRFAVMTKENPFNWRVTPLGGVALRGSIDLASGALLWQGGVANTIDYRVNPKLVVCVINQFTLHRSIAVDYGDFRFDPQIDQQIMKNGFRIVSPLTTRLVGDFFVVDTRFLKDAAVKSFQTVGGSLSLRATKSFNLTLGANYDTGSRFKAYSVGLSSAWRW